MFIYVIKNSATGKVYIGQHKGNNLKKYLQMKLSQAVYELKRKGKGGGSYLFASMRKHSKDVWSIEPLFEGIETKEELDRLERLLIALYDTRNPEVGYNICRGGEGYTGPFTEEMKAAWQAGNKAYWESLNLIGQTFGRLTVQSEISSRSRGKKLWNCQCTCGNTTIIRTYPLTSGSIRSCGCLITEAGRTRWAKMNLVGQTFGRLTVQSEAAHYRSQRQWNCLCSCGQTTVVRTGSLKSKNTGSCGRCLVNHLESLSRLPSSGA